MKNLLEKFDFGIRRLKLKSDVKVFSYLGTVLRPREVFDGFAPFTPIRSRGYDCERQHVSIYFLKIAHGVVGYVTAVFAFNPTAVEDVGLWLWICD